MRITLKKILIVEYSSIQFVFLVYFPINRKINSNATPVTFHACMRSCSVVGGEEFFVYFRGQLTSKRVVVSFKHIFFCYSFG